MRKCRTFALAVLSALALTGCALKPAPERTDVQKDATPNLVVPPQWSSSGTLSGTVSDDWLAGLRDAELDALVTEALLYNADLRIAAARVEAAAGALRASGSALWPQVNLLARGGGKMSGDSSGLQGVGLFATWELDLWGRVRANTRATELQYDSFALDAVYARQSIAALVAKGWLLAIEARLQRDLARSVIASSEQLLSLSQDRLRVGNGNEYEVSLMQASVDSYRDAERTLELAYQNALRGLEILIGRYPAARIEVAKGLPSWSGDVPAGVPSELLERRPDVVAAERRVAAAFYRTEEAKAARLPRISLTANFTSVTSELFVLQERDNPLFSFGGSLLQPIFLGGLLSAQIDVRTAEQKAAIADYGRVTLRVFNEVESALSATAIAAQRETILGRGVASNQKALDLSRVRFRVGSGDLRAVQDQQLALYSAQVALLRAQSEKLVQRVNLHLALGGGFPPPTPVP